jgi:serine kinase of HPr protein (carbohydrate metabolism regulator)
MTAAGASIHATAVKVGNQAILIRGPSGSGKSRLAFDLILAGRAGQIPAAILVGDDRVHLDTRGEEVWVRPAAALAGLIEIYGLGIRACDFVPEARVGLLVDLMAKDAARFPSPESLQAGLNGVVLPRIPIAAGLSPLSIVVAALITTETSCPDDISPNCAKQIGNHIRPTIAPK